MIGALIHLLIVLIVVLVICYVVKLLATQLGLPPTVVQLVGIVLGLLFLLYVLQLFGVGDRWRWPAG
jgi:hypothetical protein